MPNDFFEKPTLESEAKIRIVSKYFDAWSNVLAPKSTLLGYVDLFAGPGMYDDRTDSTPLCILKIATRKELQRKLIVIFNDENYSEQLKLNLRTFSEIATFPQVPKTHNKQVDSDIVQIFAPLLSIPTLYFIDPWGYKGVSIDLIGTCIAPFGSDCIFFFNYARINAGLDNDLFAEHMSRLFGQDRFLKLRERLRPMSPKEREKEIIAEMKKALQSVGGTYVHDFGVSFADRPGRTSHYLFHVTKHPLGNRIIKRITAKESTVSIQGVPKFRFDKNEDKQGSLFDTPMDDLEESLLNVFNGQKLSVGEIIMIHPLKSDIKATDTNYKNALINLERVGKVAADRSLVERRPGTLADSVIISFPRRR